MDRQLGRKDKNDVEVSRYGYLASEPSPAASVLRRSLFGLRPKGAALCQPSWTAPGSPSAIETTCCMETTCVADFPILSGSFEPFRNSLYFNDLCSFSGRTWRCPTRATPCPLYTTMAYSGPKVCQAVAKSIVRRKPIQMHSGPAGRSLARLLCPPNSATSRIISDGCDPAVAGD